jgi:Cu(I)/Ag(I) efflux system membrane fusion protein
VVIVAQGEGKFAPVDVEIGIETNGQTEIRKGLEAGQKVVVSGQFLIDSESSLRATATRMGEPQPGAADALTGSTHKGTAKVEKIDKGEVILSHGPIASLQWPPMTMGFKPPASGLPRDIVVGDTLSFEYRQSKEGPFEIIAISRAGK